MENAKTIEKNKSYIMFTLTINVQLYNLAHISVRAQVIAQFSALSLFLYVFIIYEINLLLLKIKKKYLIGSFACVTSNMSLQF